MLNAFIWRTVNNAMFTSLIEICVPMLWHAVMTSQRQLQCCPVPSVCHVCMFPNNSGDNEHWAAMSTSLVNLFKIFLLDDLWGRWMELSNNQLPDDGRRLSEDHPDPGVHPSLGYDHQKARPDNLPAIFDFTKHFNKWFHLYDIYLKDIVIK